MTADSPAAAPQRIRADRAWPLHGAAATRRIETALAATLAPHTLMRRAGLATARLALALAPHAGRIWIACGAGNNGGDGLEAALQLHLADRPVSVTWLGDPQRAPADALQSWQRALAAGVPFHDEPPSDLGAQDLCIDALLGVGFTPAAGRGTPPRLTALARALRGGPATLLCVDLPSGLGADTGVLAQGFGPASAAAPVHTLALLTLKPGLFTADGRDAAGTVWLDPLGADLSAETTSAWLVHPIAGAHRHHASHKGSHGDVAVIGGAQGMAGAAVLAASAALHAGAGRVFLAPADDSVANAAVYAAPQPELMLRAPAALDLPALTAVCGCGGGDAVAALLPRVLAQAGRLVLDADALNAVARDTALQAALARRAAQQQQPTVITPHPLEAARLLGTTTAAVQADRLQAARALATRFACVAVLKGSGTVIAAPGGALAINPTGNGRLATGGTGDVLAGMAGALLAGGSSAWDAATGAVFAHGLAADRWPAGTALTASALARRGITYS